MMKHNSNITKSSIITLLIRTIGMLLAALINFYLAYRFGAALYGEYIYAITILGFIVVFASFGYESVLVRYVSSYKEEKVFMHLNGIIRFVCLKGFMIGVGFSVVLVSIVLNINTMSYDLKMLYAITFVAIPFITGSNFRSSILRGYQHTEISIVPETIIFPIFFIAQLAIIYFLMNIDIRSYNLAIVYLVSYLASFIFSAYFLHKKRLSDILDISALYSFNEWNSMALPMFAISLIHILMNKMDIFLLGILLDSSDVGIYALAARISEITLLLFDATSLVIVSMIAAYYSSNEYDKLQDVLLRASKLMVILTLPISLVIYIFAPMILSLFGNDYASSVTVIRILVVGHFLSVCIGAVAQILYMTGNQRYVIKHLVIAVLINIILILTLVPKFGVHGAAIASLLSLLIYKLSLMFVIKKKLNLHTSILTF